MGILDNYKDQARTDILIEYANFFLEPYKTADELNEAIENGSYTGLLYQEGNKKPVAHFKLEKNEGKYCIFEGSTWIVAWYDILNRWYQENKNFIDKHL